MHNIGPKMDAKKVDVAKMAKALCIRAHVIKAALSSSPGMDISNITSVEEATKVWKEAEEGSPRRALVMRFWIELCDNVCEAEDVWGNASEHSYEEVLAMQKWIWLCKTIEEIADAYDFAPQGSTEEALALQQWITLCRDEGELIRVLNKTRACSPEQRMALRALTTHYPKRSRSSAGAV